MVTDGSAVPHNQCGKSRRAAICPLNICGSIGRTSCASVRTDALKPSLLQPISQLWPTTAICGYRQPQEGGCHLDP